MKMKMMMVMGEDQLGSVMQIWAWSFKCWNVWINSVVQWGGRLLSKISPSRMKYLVYELSGI